MIPERQKTNEVNPKICLCLMPWDIFNVVAHGEKSWSISSPELRRWSWVTEKAKAVRVCREEFQKEEDWTKRELETSSSPLQYSAKKVLASESVWGNWGWDKKRLNVLKEIVHNAHTGLRIEPILINLTEKSNNWYTEHSEGFYLSNEKKVYF